MFCLAHSIVFSISLPWSLRKAFLSFLAILWNSAFKWVYLSFSHLPLASLLFSVICKACSDNHFSFCISFLWGWSWSLPLVQCVCVCVFIYTRIYIYIHIHIADSQWCTAETSTIFKATIFQLKTENKTKIQQFWRYQSRCWVGGKKVMRERCIYISAHCLLRKSWTICWKLLELKKENSRLCPAIRLMYVKE